MTLRATASLPSAVSALSLPQSADMTVGRYLPGGHASFVRVMNPVRGQGIPARSWASYSAGSVKVDATTRWNDLVDGSSPDRPDKGTIDPEVAVTLSRILRSHTRTPADCYFLVWEGYAGLRADVLTAARVELPLARWMFVLTGDLRDGIETVGESVGGRTAQWWLPADGAWAVGNDLYGASVYISGSAELIEGILAADDIEAYRATASMVIVAEEFEP